MGFFLSFEIQSPLQRRPFEPVLRSWDTAGRPRHHLLHGEGERDAPAALQPPLGLLRGGGREGVGGERVGLVPPHREVGGGAGASQCPTPEALAQRGDVEAGSTFQMIKKSHGFSPNIFLK